MSTVEIPGNYTSLSAVFIYDRRCIHRRLHKCMQKTVTFLISGWNPRYSNVYVFCIYKVMIHVLQTAHPFLCIYVYIYICIVPCMYVYTWVFIHTYIHIYIYIYICIHSYIHTYIYMYTHTHTSTYICKRAQTYFLAAEITRMYTFCPLYKCIHTHLHAYTYIHIHTHTFIWIMIPVLQNLFKRAWWYLK